MERMERRRGWRRKRREWSRGGEKMAVEESETS